MMAFGFNSSLGIQKVRTELTVLTLSNVPWLTTIEEVITAIKRGQADTPNYFLTQTKIISRAVQVDESGEEDAMTSFLLRTYRRSL